eukprot:3862712-Alexandrium_andersonii.AAC.1
MPGTTSDTSLLEGGAGEAKHTHTHAFRVWARRKHTYMHTCARMHAHTHARVGACARLSAFVGEHPVRTYMCAPLHPCTEVHA